MKRARKSILAVLVLFGGALVVAVAAFSLIVGQALLFDERAHHWQSILISRDLRGFLSGSFKLNVDLAPAPGYHFFLAVGKKLFSINDKGDSLRILSALFCSCSIPIFLLCAKRTVSAAMIPRTLMFFFLPILFPYFFLIYTDALSVTLLLAGFYAYLKRRPNVSGLLFSISILVRQTNIVFAMMVFCLAFLEESKSFTFASMRKHCRQYWIFILLALLFILVAIYRGGVATNAMKYHTIVFSVGNLFMLLLIYFLLFLPYGIWLRRDLVASLKDKRYALFVVLPAFLLFWFLFEATHPFNHGPNYVRNDLLRFIATSELHRLFFFLPVFFSLHFLRILRLSTKEHYILFLFIAAFLIPQELIEPRYYIPPLTIYLLFLSPQKLSREYLTATYFAILSGSYLYFISTCRQLL